MDWKNVDDVKKQMLEWADQPDGILKILTYSVSAAALEDIKLYRGVIDHWIEKYGSVSKFNELDKNSKGQLSTRIIEYSTLGNPLALELENKLIAKWKKKWISVSKYFLLSHFKQKKLDFLANSSLFNKKPGALLTIAEDTVEHEKRHGVFLMSNPTNITFEEFKKSDEFKNSDEISVYLYREKNTFYFKIRNRVYSEAYHKFPRELYQATSFNNQKCMNEEMCSSILEIISAKIPKKKPPLRFISSHAGAGLTSKMGD